MVFKVHFVMMIFCLTALLLLVTSWSLTNCFLFFWPNKGLFGNVILVMFVFLKIRVMLFKKVYENTCNVV